MWSGKGIGKGKERERGRRGVGDMDNIPGCHIYLITNVNIFHTCI